MVVASVMRMTQSLEQWFSTKGNVTSLPLSGWKCLKTLLNVGKGVSVAVLLPGGGGQGCYYGSYSAQDAPTAKKPQLVRVVLNDLGNPGGAKPLLGDTARSEQSSS